jgi:hypothetical protein
MQPGIKSRYVGPTHAPTRTRALAVTFQSRDDCSRPVTVQPQRDLARPAALPPAASCRQDRRERRAGPGRRREPEYGTAQVGELSFKLSEERPGALSESQQLELVACYSPRGSLAG